MEQRGDKKVYQILSELEIEYDYHEHPAVPTVDEASKYWQNIESTHCKNLFFRNHKGNRHYLVILEYSNSLNIKDLEHRLKQGKLSLGSPRRLMRYLKLQPGSVSPFGLIHDTENHVHVFLDENLRRSERISFHPNLNTASLIISYAGFEKFMLWTGNTFEYVRLYD